MLRQRLFRHSAAQRCQVSFIKLAVCIHQVYTYNNSVTFRYELFYNRTSDGAWNARYGRDPLHQAYNMSSQVTTVQANIDASVIAVRSSPTVTTDVKLDIGVKAFPELVASTSAKNIFVVRTYGRCYTHAQSENNILD